MKTVFRVLLNLAGLALLLQISALLNPTGLNEQFMKEISDQKPYSADEYGLGESIQTWDRFKVKYHLK